MSQTTAIIQARASGGTRLPGIVKVLHPLAGVPMLRRVVERVKLAREIKSIVVAIPDTPANDGLAEYVLERGWDLARGPEEDTLARYALAAEQYDADPIVRVTADCPFLDPGVLNGLVLLQRNSGADFVTNNIERSFPIGLSAEVFTREALRTANMDDGHSTETREGVTLALLDHEAEFRVENLTAPPGCPDWFPTARWTVDTPADLAFAQAVLRALGGRLDFTTAEVVELLERVPALRQEAV